MYSIYGNEAPVEVNDVPVGKSRLVPSETSRFTGIYVKDVDMTTSEKIPGNCHLAESVCRIKI